MVLKIVLGVALLGALASCSGTTEEFVPNEANETVPDAQMIYMNHCTVCHGPNGDLGGSGAKDLTKSKLSEEKAKKVILKGKGTMPPFEYLITTDEERAAILQYIMEMRKDELNE